MVIAINLICILFSVYVLNKSMKRKICASILCLMVFDVAYVLPLLVESFLGNAPTAYTGFRLAQNDLTTSFVYGFFVILVELILYINIKNKEFSRRNVNISNKICEFRKNLNSNTLVGMLAICLILVSAIGIILAPHPSLYIVHISTFEMKTVSASVADSNYNTNIMGYVKLVSFLGVVLLKLYDTSGKKGLTLIRFFGIVLVTLIDGKRTLFAFLMLLLLAIDFFSLTNKRKFVRKAIITTIAVVGYFIVYSYLTGKYEYNTNWFSVISEYFFKSNSVKIAIYSVLNPDKLKILDYPLQTFIYDVLFFIPRSIWPEKPYAYPQYYSSAVFGHESLTSIGWYFQTGLYAEFISNIGLAGIIIGPLFILWLCKKVDNSKSLLATILGMMFTALIQVFEYSDGLKVIFIFWMLVIIKDNVLKVKIRIKKKKISIKWRP